MWERREGSVGGASVGVGSEQRAQRGFTGATPLDCGLQVAEWSGEGGDGRGTMSGERRGGEAGAGEWGSDAVASC